MLIKDEGVLKNLDIKFSRVNMILGDNERGKTTLLNLVADALFSKPKTECDVESFYPYYDGDRMRSLLYIHQNDLKTRQFENKRDEMYSLLYGTDDISPRLQKSFAKAMGIGSKAWLADLHDRLFEFKDSLEDMLPEIEKINSKAEGLYRLNNSLGEINQNEKEIFSKEELYFMMDKIETGEKYLSALDKQKQIEAQNLEIENLAELSEKLKSDISAKEDEMLDLDADTDRLKIELNQANSREQQALTDPQDAYNKGWGEIILSACIGAVMLVTGLSLVFQTMHNSMITPLKFISLLVFIAGVFFVLRAAIHTVSLQKLAQSSEKNPNSTHRYLISRARRDAQKTGRRLDKKQKALQKSKDELAELKKQQKTSIIKLDASKKVLRESELFADELAKSSESAANMFGTEDASEIQTQLDELKIRVEGQHADFSFGDLQELRSRKEDVIQQKNDMSESYGKSKSFIINKIRSSIDGLQNIDKMCEHFYPEIYTMQIKNLDMDNYRDLLETAEYLINKVGGDCYRAEKLLSIHHNLQNSSETLLARTVASPFFKHLASNIFGGKYQNFVCKKGFEIFVENHEGDFIPIESLSPATYMQFWFILKLSIAKAILKDQSGVLIMDDPFNGFDNVRKQYFLDVVNALAHQGWQIFISVTNDPFVINYFHSVFKNTLNLVDLNKDYFAEDAKYAVNE